VPNAIATLAYFIWPFFIIYFFAKYKVKKALFISFILSSLLLPSSYVIDLPLIPAFQRDGLTAISVLLALTILKKKYKLFQSGILLLFGYFLSVILTSIYNSEPLLLPNRYIPGATIHDAFASIFGVMLTFIPFLLAKYYSKKVEDLELLFKILIASALIYSIPMLLEVRISPQLHRIVYGYVPSQFLQSMRDGGFRPIVFFGHGLPLAVWFSSAVIASYTLLRYNIKSTKFFRPRTVFIILSIVLLLCKTFSAILYMGLGIFLLKFFKPYRIVQFAFISSLLVLSYPLSKITGFFPEQLIVDSVETINADRAKSLKFRLDNEQALLKKALEKPLLGWGGWGRHRIYDEWGGDISVTDGFWIIQVGVYGISGFLLYYSILLMPIFLALKNFKYITHDKSKFYIASVSYILFFFILDSIPNANFTPMNYLLAGAFMGQMEYSKRKMLTK